MRQFALALAAAAALGLAAPLAADAAPMRLAQATTTTVVKPGATVVVKKNLRRHHMARHGCKTVIVKKHRGHRVIVTKVRRCR